MFTIGLDFGTDSCRAQVIACDDGAVHGEGVAEFARWGRGEFCDGGEDRFRQHPEDHRAALTAAVDAALVALDAEQRAAVAGIAVASTASTPIAVDTTGRALVEQERWRDDPDACFWLWKDHTALAEADELAAHWHARGAAGGHDCTRYTGGTCSPEWYWPKLLRLLRTRPDLASAAAGFVEHADWVPAVLGECAEVAAIVRNRCCAGHKGQWHPRWGGPPPADEMEAVDAQLAIWAARHPQRSVTHDQAAARLGTGWAARWGLPAGIPIAAGLIDAHGGAIGAGGRAGVLVKVVGTSNCDLLLADPERLGERAVPGISGQALDAVLPGTLCLEAGQAAFGDALHWFADLLRWPLHAGLPTASVPERSELIAALVTAALREPWGAGGVYAIDWLNGRRSPDPDPHARGAFGGLSLGSDAPRLFRALLEALVCGSRAIHERFAEHAVPIDAVIALGGIAHKSPPIMQLMADVIDIPITVAGSPQAVALGAAMNAAVAAGIHPDLPRAQAAMVPEPVATYRPDPAKRADAEACWQAYAARTRR